MIDRTVAADLRRAIRDDATLAAVRELEQTGTMHTLSGDREVRIGPVCTEVGRHLATDGYCATGTSLYQLTLMSLRRLAFAGDVECVRGAGPGGAHRWLAARPPIDLSGYEWQRPACTCGGDGAGPRGEDLADDAHPHPCPVRAWWERQT